MFGLKGGSGQSCYMNQDFERRLLLAGLTFALAYRRHTVELEESVVDVCKGFDILVAFGSIGSRKSCGA